MSVRVDSDLEFPFYIGSRKYPLFGYILAVLMHTTALDQYRKGDETLD